MHGLVSAIDGRSHPTTLPVDPRPFIYFAQHDATLKVPKNCDVPQTWSHSQPHAHLVPALHQPYKSQLTNNLSRSTHVCQQFRILSSPFLSTICVKPTYFLGEPTTIGDASVLPLHAALEQHLGGFAPQFASAGPIEEKKSKKKRTHDPNAPKRPLTPYFLYMQTARPIIANDLGENAPKREQFRKRVSADGPP